jgi:hypothetical protein
MFYCNGAADVEGSHALLQRYMLIMALPALLVAGSPIMKSSDPDNT